MLPSTPCSLEVTAKPTLTAWQQYSTSSWAECLCKLSLILLHGNIISFLHLFIYSFIYLFIYISTDSQVNILYFWLQPSTSLFFCVAQIITALAIGSSPCWFLFHWHMLLTVFLLCFEHILIFWTKWFCKFISYTSCLSPRISHVSKELQSIWLENAIRNQNLDARYVHSNWTVIC